MDWMAQVFRSKFTMQHTVILKNLSKGDWLMFFTQAKIMVSVTYTLWAMSVFYHPTMNNTFHLTPTLLKTKAFFFGLISTVVYNTPFNIKIIHSEYRLFKIVFKILNYLNRMCIVATNCGKCNHYITCSKCMCFSGIKIIKNKQTKNIACIS
jgi:hypothetical protein